MNCEEISELLPGYAFGALDADEMAAVEAHLRDCNEHEAELVELRAAVFALDRFAREAEPSPALAGRVAAIPDLLAATEQPPKLRLLPSTPIWRAAAAAVVLVLVFGAGWLLGHSSDGGSNPEVSFVLQGPNGQLVSLDGSPASSVVYVTMAGFERQPAGSAYQLWAVSDGVWASIGVCNTNADGGWVGTFPYSIRPGEAIALTVEPAGGSPSPTSDPILQSIS